MTTGHGEKRSRKEEALIAALLSQPTVEAAARATGVSERTARRWLAEPTFRRAFREARRQAVETAVAALQGASGESVVALREALSARRVSVRVRAACAILDRAVRGVELIDILERLEALEGPHEPRDQ